MTRDLLRRCQVILKMTRPESSLIAEIEAALEPTAKFRSDNYLLTTFDRHGGKVETLSLGNVGLIAARKQAEALIEADQCASAAVMRVLWNSKDRDPIFQAKRPDKVTLDPGPPSCTMVTR